MAMNSVTLRLNIYCKVVIFLINVVEPFILTGGGDVTIRSLTFTTTTDITLHSMTFKPSFTKTTAKSIISTGSERVATVTTAIPGLTEPATDENLTTNENYPKLTTSIDFSIDKCVVNGQCEFTSRLNRPYCRCDYLCSKYGDCCSDVTPEPYNVTEYDHHFVCYSRGSRGGPSSYSGIFVVESCQNENTSLSERCHNDSMIDSGPFVISSDNITFKNEFCALCHGVTDYRFYTLKFYPRGFPSIQTSINSSEQLEYFIRNDFDYEMIEPDNSEIRTCLANLIENYTPYCQLSPTNPVQYMRHSFYKNIYCVPVSLKELVTCIGRYLDYITTTFDLFPLTVMFNVKQVLQPKTQNKAECQIWTPEIEEEGLCKDEETYINIGLLLSPFVITSTQPIENLDHVLIGLIYGWALQVTGISIVYEVKILKDQNSTSVRYDLLHLKITKRIFKQELHWFEKRFNEFSWRASFVDNNNNQSIELEKNHSNVSSGQNNIRAIPIKGNINKQLQYFGVIIPDTPLEICDDIELHIVRNSSVVKFEVKQCRARSEQYQRLRRHPITVQTIMTYSFFSVSSIALIVLIVINKKIKLTTGTAGSNLVNLSVSLLGADVVFMVGIGNNDYPTLCYFISILLHYLWLMVFTFMSIGVVCIEVNLTKFHREPSTTSVQRLLTVLGLTIPLFFVGTAVVFDLTGPEALSPGYGSAICFPNRYPGNLLFFSGPIMLSLLINFVSLTLIIHKAYKVNLETRKVSQRRGITNAQIFLRIICLSNFFWVTGILASILDASWLSYVFTYLCGLHGLFIAIASLSTNQARRQMNCMLLKTKKTETIQTKSVIRCTTSFF